MCQLVSWYYSPKAGWASDTKQWGLPVTVSPNLIHFPRLTAEILYWLWMQWEILPLIVLPESEKSVEYAPDNPRPSLQLQLTIMGLQQKF